MYAHDADVLVFVVSELCVDVKRRVVQRVQKSKILSLLL